jgi:hypothetical protein
MISFSANWFANLESQIRAMGADSDAQSFDEINQYLKALNMSTHEYVKGVLTDNKPVSKVAEMYASMKTQSASFAFKNVLCTFAENNKTLADNLRKITGMDALLRKHGVEESV